MSVQFAVSMVSCERLTYLSVKFSQREDVLGLITGAFPDGYIVKQVKVDSESLFIVSGEKGDLNKYVIDLFQLGSFAVYGNVYILPFDLRNPDFESSDVQLRRLLTSFCNAHRKKQKLARKAGRKLMAQLKKGVKLQRRPYDIFASEFHRESRDSGLPFSDIAKKARSAWSSMTVDQQRKYVTLSDADGLRYQRELAAFTKLYPNPAEKPRKPYILYNIDMKSRGEPLQAWKTVPASTKQIYVSRATDELVAMQKRNSDFLDWCETNQLDPSLVVSSWRKHGLRNACVLPKCT